MESHTASYIAGILRDCITAHGEEKFMSIVMDNASANVAAMKILAKDFPHIEMHGCICHVINLLVSDFRKLKNVSACLDEAKDIVTNARSCHFAKAFLDEIGVGETLKLFVPTRWLSAGNMFRSLTNNKKNLRKLAIQDRLNQKLRKLLDSFWKRIDDLNSIFEAINTALTAMESDACPMGECMNTISAIEKCINDIDVGHTLWDEKEAMLSFFRKRRAMGLKPLHLAAHLLNPYHSEELLQPDEHQSAIKFLISRGQFEKANVANLLSEFAQFRAREGVYAGNHYYAVLTNRQVLTARTWWKTFFPWSVLSQLAVKILETPPSSAAVERSFSLQKNVHTITRNRLGHERVHKSMYIKANTMALEQKSHCRTPQDNEVLDSVDVDAEDTDWFIGEIPVPDLPDYIDNESNSEEEASDDNDMPQEAIDAVYTHKVSKNIPDALRGANDFGVNNQEEQALSVKCGEFSKNTPVNEAALGSTGDLVEYDPYPPVAENFCQVGEYYPNYDAMLGDADDLIEYAPE